MIQENKIINLRVAPSTDLQYKNREVNMTRRINVKFCLCSTSLSLVGIVLPVITGKPMVTRERNLEQRQTHNIENLT